MVIKAFDTTIAFLSCHLSSNAVADRRNGYKQLVEKAGNSLGDRYFQLLEQFHHVVFFGDLNYRIDNMKGDKALKLISSGRIDELLDHDQLYKEMLNGTTFADFKEPRFAPDFIPTYKKKEARPVPTDWNDPKWADLMYRTLFKEAFYKGGKKVIRVPSFCDRIIYHSLESKSTLAPKALNLKGRQSWARPSLACKETEDIWQAGLTADNIISENDFDEKTAPPAGRFEPQPISLSDTSETTPHHYHAMNDILTTSDHTAIWGGFFLHSVVDKRLVVLRLTFLKAALYNVPDAGPPSVVRIKHVRLLFPGAYEDAKLTAPKSSLLVPTQRNDDTFVVHQGQGSPTGRTSGSKKRGSLKRGSSYRRRATLDSTEIDGSKTDNSIPALRLDFSAPRRQRSQTFFTKKPKNKPPQPPHRESYVSEANNREENLPPMFEGLLKQSMNSASLLLKFHAIDGKSGQCVFAIGRKYFVAGNILELVKPLTREGSHTSLMAKVMVKVSAHRPEEPPQRGRRTQRAVGLSNPI